MSVEVRPLDPDDETDVRSWNRAVERADGTNPFYRTEAIELQANETKTTPHLLAGFKGQELIGLFPIFGYRKGPIRAAFSPAPYSWSCYLGPATVSVNGLKQRKADRRNRRFLEGVLAWIDHELSPMYSKFVAAEFEDLRPFTWNGYDVEPTYTYVVDLDGDESDVLDRFAGDARSNVRNANEDAYVIEEGTGDDVERIVEQVRNRYESQGKGFHLSPSFARNLYDALPDGAIRPYACRIDGEFLGGILVVESRSIRYRWQGGVKPGSSADVDLPINDLLDWHIMRDGLEAGIDHYDLVGAGVPSINRYKAKFNPRLETNYTITSGAFGLDALIDRYRKGF